MAWTTLCHLADLEEGLGRYVEIDGFRLAVFSQNGRIVTLDDACPHAGGAMSAGWIDDGCAVCPLHGWSFDLATGALRGGDTNLEMIKIYPTRVLEDGDRSLVQADLPMP